MKPEKKINTTDQQRRMRKHNKWPGLLLIDRMINWGLGSSSGSYVRTE